VIIIGTGEREGNMIEQDASKASSHSSSKNFALLLESKGLLPHYNMSLPMGCKFPCLF